MDAFTARHQNFLALFDAFKKANATLPDRGMLKLFGEHVDISPRFLTHIKGFRKRMGNEVARKLEEKCGKPHGWMDVPHSEFDAKNIAERQFIETAVLLYRASPGEAANLMSELLKQRLNSKS